MANDKNPVKQRAGALGAAKRWVPENRRVVRLADLDADEAAIIRSLLSLKARRTQADEPKAAA